MKPRPVKRRLSRLHLALVLLLEDLLRLTPTR